jgi:hypothetical protein
MSVFDCPDCSRIPTTIFAAWKSIAACFMFQMHISQKGAPPRKEGRMSGLQPVGQRRTSGTKLRPGQRRHPSFSVHQLPKLRPSSTIKQTSSIAAPIVSKTPSKCSNDSSARYVSLNRSPRNITDSPSTAQRTLLRSSTSPRPRPLCAHTPSSSKQTRNPSQPPLKTRPAATTPRTRPSAQSSSSMSQRHHPRPTSSRTFWII